MALARSSVSLIIDKGAHDSPVTLINTRNDAIARACSGQPLPVVRLMLRSLLGLCPVAQCAALEAAAGAAGLAAGEILRVAEPVQQLAAVEAVLETLRVLSLDLRSLVSRAHVSDASLKTIGALRAGLWQASGRPKCAADEAASLYEQAAALAMLWLTREKKTVGSIKSAYDRFEGMTLEGTKLLFPEELASVTLLRFFYDELERTPEFALEPRLMGYRIPGALARLRSRYESSTEARRDFSVKDLVVARLVELRHVAAGKPTPYTVYGVGLGENTGAGVVETARGTLLHFVRREGETVATLRIMAPTEWSFQAGSPLNQLMNRYAAERLSTPKTTETGLKMMSAAFDACTPVYIQWKRGEHHA